MTQHEIYVGNVGCVASLNNPVAAQCEYSAWIKVSKGESAGRAKDEIVTWFRDGEIHRQYEPRNEWMFVEVTDTQGPRGSTNYGWVQRFKVHAKRHRGALRKLPFGPGWSHTMDIADEMGTRRFDKRGSLICAFACAFDPERHANLARVQVIT